MRSAPPVTSSRPEVRTVGRSLCARARYTRRASESASGSSRAVQISSPSAPPSSRTSEKYTRADSEKSAATATWSRFADLGRPVSGACSPCWSNTLMRPGRSVTRKRSDPGRRARLHAYTRPSATGRTMSSGDRADEPLAGMAAATGHWKEQAVRAVAAAERDPGLAADAAVVIDDDAGAVRGTTDAEAAAALVARGPV